MLPGDHPEPGHARSLVRGLAILACFTAERPVRGVVDVADEIGLSYPTAHRYLNTLVALGYLQQAPQHKYRLTLGVTRLGLSALAATALRDHAHRSLEELCKRSLFTTSLVVLDGPEILCLDRVYGIHCEPRRGELDLRPESRLPVHCTATGKLLLAYLQETDRNRLLREMTLTPETPNTLTSRRALREQLKRIRATCFAASDQELVPDMRAIAVPIRSIGREVVAALGMAAPTTAISLANLVKHLKPHLIACAHRISARLGYRGPVSLQVDPPRRLL